MSTLSVAIHSLKVINYHHQSLFLLPVLKFNQPAPVLLCCVFLQCEMEEAQLGLLHREEVINQVGTVEHSKRQAVTDQKVKMLLYKFNSI